MSKNIYINVHEQHDHVPVSSALTDTARKSNGTSEQRS